MFCKNCGTSIPDDAQFCLQCGSKLNTSSTAGTQALLRRAMIFLEDELWAKADDYCERVLDIEPENAQAYFIKLMIRAQVKKEEDLAKMHVSYAGWHAYQSALRFSDEQQKKKLTAYLQSTEESIRAKELEEIQKQQEQERKEEEERNSKIYRDACYYDRTNATISDLILSVDLFKKIPDYKDSAARAQSCSQRLQTMQSVKYKHSLEAFRAQQRAKRRKITLGIVIAIALLTAIVLLVNLVANSNKGKAENIRSALKGISFSGSYTDYTSGSSEDQFRPVTSMKEYDVTYYFKDDGSVDIKTFVRSGGGVYYTDSNGDRIWDNSSSTIRTVSSYDIEISFWGTVTLTIDGEEFTLTLDYNDKPLTLENEGITYS